MASEVEERACGPGRRRLTLAPPAWMGTSGSRFQCLGGLTAESSGAADLDGEHIAVRTALSAMEVDVCSLTRSPPPELSDEEIRQQF